MKFWERIGKSVRIDAVQLCITSLMEKIRCLNGITTEVKIERAAILILVDFSGLVKMCYAVSLVNNRYLPVNSLKFGSLCLAISVHLRNSRTNWVLRTKISIIRNKEYQRQSRASLESKVNVFASIGYPYRLAAALVL